MIQIHSQPSGMTILLISFLASIPIYPSLSFPYVNMLHYHGTFVKSKKRTLVHSLSSRMYFDFTSFFTKFFLLQDPIRENPLHCCHVSLSLPWSVTASPSFLVWPECNSFEKSFVECPSFGFVWCFFSLDGTGWDCGFLCPQRSIPTEVPSHHMILRMTWYQWLLISDVYRDHLVKVASIFLNRKVTSFLFPYCVLWKWVIKSSPH